VLLAVIEAAQRRPRLRLVNGLAVIETSFDLEPRVGRGTRSELLATYSMALQEPCRTSGSGGSILSFATSVHNASKSSEVYMSIISRLEMPISGGVPI
jgi:hypothetical protein